jgi:uncharacterized membrane protein YkvA (DUF1232 family)
MKIITRLKTLVRKLKEEIVPIYYALLDKRTPVIAKLMAVLTLGYMLSPIDLIPDFVPVLGLLDDLILVPVLIKITLSLIPIPLIQEFKSKVTKDQKLPKKWYFAIPIILIYLIIAIYLLKVFGIWK